MASQLMMEDMRFFLMLLLLVSCSSEKKSDKKFAVSTDNDERVSYDWTGDGLPETILIGPHRYGDEFRELAVFRGTLEGAPKEKVFSNRSVIPVRAKPGGKLRLQKDLSVLLTIDSSGSGRALEVVNYKISWKRGRFIVTGISRDWTDKLDPNDHKSCDVDLRSGRGLKNGKTVKFPPVTIELIDLNEQLVPEVCQF